MESIDLTGRVALVTGATSGIGRVTAEALAGMGAEVFLACRSQHKGELAAQEIAGATGNDRVTPLVADLASLGEVRRLARAFLSRDKPLHLLVNNAAVMNFERRLTVDGYEEMFAVNHLAPFLLTNLLLDRLEASAPARIVNVASGIYSFVKGIPFDDLDANDNFGGMRVYGHSKLANILFTRELATRLAGSGVTVNALHPGAVATGLGRQNGWFGKTLATLMKPFLKSPQKGARTSLYVSISPELDGVSGRYFEACREQPLKASATDEAAARRLWEISANMTSADAG